MQKLPLEFQIDERDPSLFGRGFCFIGGRGEVHWHHGFFRLSAIKTVEKRRY